MEYRVALIIIKKLINKITIFQRYKYEILSFFFFLQFVWNWRVSFTWVLGEPRDMEERKKTKERKKERERVRERVERRRIKAEKEGEEEEGGSELSFSAPEADTFADTRHDHPLGVLRIFQWKFCMKGTPRRLEARRGADTNNTLQISFLISLIWKRKLFPLTKKSQKRFHLLLSLLYESSSLCATFCLAQWWNFYKISFYSKNVGYKKL